MATVSRPQLQPQQCQQSVHSLVMDTVKRKCQTEEAEEEVNDNTEEPGQTENYQPAEKKRRVEFQDVTIYNFNRRQGYICVPSQVSCCKTSEINPRMCVNFYEQAQFNLSKDKKSRNF